MDMQEIETEVSEMEIPSEEIVLEVLDLTITTAHAIGAERAFKEHLFKDNAKQAALVLFEVLSLGHKVYPDPHAQCSLLPGPEKEGETSMPCAAAVHRVQEYLESNAHEIQVLLAVKGDEASRLGVKSYLKLLHKMDASLSHHEIQHFIKYQMEAGKERTTMGFIDVQKAVKRAVRNLSPIPPVKYETHWCPMEEPRPCAVDGHTPFVVAVQSVKKRSRLLSSPSSSQSSILSMQSQPKSISVPSVTSSESIVEPFLKTPRDMDSATLSHLFSVVTPRQMDPAEHARRRELLEYLEMCSERAKIKKENKRRVREGELEMQKKWKGLGKGNYCLDHNGVAIPLLSLDSSMQHRTSIPVETKWQPDEEQEPEPKFNDHTLKKKRFKLRIGEAYVPKDVPELVTTRLEPGVSSFVDGRSHVGPPLRPKRGKRRLNSFRAEAALYRSQSPVVEKESITRLPRIPTKVKKKSKTISKPATPSLPLKLPQLSPIIHLKPHPPHQKKRHKQQAWERQVSPPRMRKNAPLRRVHKGLIPLVCSGRPPVRRQLQFDYFASQLREYKD